MRFQKWGIGIGLFAALAVFAADNIRFESRPGSKIKVDGTSTVHDWTVESQAFKGTMEVPADFTSGGTRNLVARLLARSDVPQTGPVSVVPGERYAIRLQMDGRVLSFLPAGP
jgi:hypothetical protein